MVPVITRTAEYSRPLITSTMTDSIVFMLSPWKTQEIKGV